LSSNIQCKGNHADSLLVLGLWRYCLLLVYTRLDTVCAEKIIAIMPLIVSYPTRVFVLMVYF